jgi:hypothetical protein
LPVIFIVPPYNKKADVNRFTSAFIPGCRPATSTLSTLSLVADFAGVLLDRLVQFRPKGSFLGPVFFTQCLLHSFTSIWSLARPVDCPVP